jgi:hypothetical protein
MRYRARSEATWTERSGERTGGSVSVRSWSASASRVSRVRYSRHESHAAPASSLSQMWPGNGRASSGPPLQGSPARRDGHGLHGALLRGVRSQLACSRETWRGCNRKFKARLRHYQSAGSVSVIVRTGAPKASTCARSALYSPSIRQANTARKFASCRQTETLPMQGGVRTRLRVIRTQGKRDDHDG